MAGALPEVFEVEGGSTLLFLPLAHSFARIIQVGCLESGAILGHWPDTGTLAEGLQEFRPTFLLAVPRVFEKVFNTAQQQAAASAAKRRIFQAAADTAVAWSRALDSGGPAAGRAAAARRCSTGWCTRGCGRRSAARSSTRCPAARRWASGWAISSAAPASPSWRATA